MNDSSAQLKTIAAFLHQESTLALATADEHGEPCVAPLFYIVDQWLSLFWFSSATARHSRNLKRMPRAAATVYRNAQGWKEIRGVQLRGSVSVITERSRRKALIELYCARFQLGAVFRVAIGGSSLYEFQPDFFRYIDNSKRFGYKFELTRRSAGWTCIRPTS